MIVDERPHRAGMCQAMVYDASGFGHYVDCQHKGKYEIEVVFADGPDTIMVCGTHKAVINRGRGGNIYDARAGSTSWTKHRHFNSKPTGKGALQSELPSLRWSYESAQNHVMFARDDVGRQAVKVMDKLQGMLPHPEFTALLDALAAYDEANRACIERRAKLKALEEQIQNYGKD